MLEGQVAVLSSKYLSAYENTDVLDALKSSALFREDQYSYILYPNKDLSRFTSKNCIPTPRAEASELIAALHKAGDKTVVLKDRNGVYHFNGMFNNVNSLNDALDQLPSGFDALVSKTERYYHPSLKRCLIISLLPVVQVRSLDMKVLVLSIGIW